MYSGSVGGMGFIGGARNRADWAWPAGSRVLQDGFTSLHRAAGRGHEVAMKVLMAAKADVHAQTKARWVEGAGRRGRPGVLCFI